MKTHLLVGSLLAACGGGGLDGPDLSGVYQVTEMLESNNSCDPQTPVAMPDAFFLLEPKELFGHDYFHHMICDSAEPASCSEGGSVGPLDTALDDGWQGGIGYASGSAPPCLLGYAFGIATESGPDRVRVEERSYADREAPTCDANDATERGTTMPCIGSTVWLGTRVGDL